MYRARQLVYATGLFLGGGEQPQPGQDLGSTAGLQAGAWQLEVSMIGLPQQTNGLITRRKGG
jgi:hypothetical protein